MCASGSAQVKRGYQLGPLAGDTITLKFRQFGPAPLRSMSPLSRYFTSFWIRVATSSRSRWLLVMTSTVSSPAIVPMISDHPA
jgi:hypothetical protein